MERPSPSGTDIDKESSNVPKKLAALVTSMTLAVTPIPTSSEALAEEASSSAVPTATTETPDRPQIWYQISESQMMDAIHGPEERFSKHDVGLKRLELSQLPQDLVSLFRDHGLEMLGEYEYYEMQNQVNGNNNIRGIFSEISRRVVVLTNNLSTDEEKERITIHELSHRLTSDLIVQLAQGQIPSSFPSALVESRFEETRSNHTELIGYYSELLVHPESATKDFVGRAANYRIGNVPQGVELTAQLADRVIRNYESRYNVRIIDLETRQISLTPAAIQEISEELKANLSRHIEKKSLPFLIDNAATIQQQNDRAKDLYRPFFRIVQASQVSRGQ